MKKREGGRGGRVVKFKVNLKWFRWECSISQEVFNHEERLLWCKLRNLVTCSSNCHKHKPIVRNCPPANLSKFETINSKTRSVNNLFYFSILDWVSNKAGTDESTCLLLYQGVQSSLIFNPSFFKAYLVDVTGILPSVSPLHKCQCHVTRPNAAIHSFILQISLVRQQSYL